MRFYTRCCFLVLGGMLSGTLLGQQKADGPAIYGFGPVWEVPDATYPTDTTATFRAVIDVMNSPEDPAAVNPWMETAVRFLNMHMRAGVPAAQLEVVLVVHNKATPGLLKTEIYREQFGVDNPNAPLLTALMEAGGRVILCGQSSYSRGVPLSKTIEGVELSLSAMTALIQLQDKGFRLIKF